MPINLQTKIHDGIIAVLNLASIALAVWVDIHFLWLAVAVAAIMISSLFTGFCPVHYTIGKVLPPAPPASSANPTDKK